MTGHQFHLGRIGSIPVYLDASFALLALLWGYSYFQAGSINGFLMGFWIVGGVALSILLHELAHAVAGRWFGVQATHIELNGLGGLCYFDRIAPSSKADIVIALAGPFTNLALWGLFSGASLGLSHALEAVENDGGLYNFIYVFSALASTNFMLFWFNLLPSHPLDGGKALSRLIGLKFGYDLGQRAIAMTGMFVCAYLVLISFGVGFFTLIIAYDMFQHNQAALDTHKGPRWRRGG